MAVTTPPRTTSTTPQEVHEPPAFRLARRAYGVFFLAMAAVNVVVASVDLDRYAEFGRDPLVGAYEHVWRSLVTPNLEVLVPALIAFEVLVGFVLWTSRSQRLRAALWAIVAFQLALVPASVYAAWNLLLVTVPLTLLWWHRTWRR
jgi:hypothetical protein